ncbi:MAG: glycosyltransferase [Desulfobacteraceae bacterium]|nr:MAG: glycosyltransferase [Desulfobacteraceae bacterium]
MSNRLRILVVAYECSPVSAHTAGSAWQIVYRLSKTYDLWVITEATQYQEEIEQYLYNNSSVSERLHFIFIDREKLKKIYTSRPVLPVHQVLSYKRWLKKAFITAKQLHKEINFDIVHHLRGNSFREPGYCWQLPVPFVWGPTGGSIGISWRLLSMLDMRESCLHVIRNIMNVLQFYISHRVCSAARKASCVFVQTSLDQTRFQKACGVKAFIAHEQAADELSYRLHQYRNNRPLKVAWAARFIPLKGLPILLNAASRPELIGRLSIHIAGDGPCRAEWEKITKDLDIWNMCVWHGWLPVRETIRMIDECDIFVCTNLLAAESTSVMQALSLGLPIICLRHGRESDIIDKTCGIPIKVGNLKSVINSYSSSLISLIQKPDLIEILSKGASKKAQIYNWTHLAEKISQAYQFTQQSNKY